MMTAEQFLVGQTVKVTAPNDRFKLTTHFGSRYLVESIVETVVSPLVRFRFVGGECPPCARYEIRDPTLIRSSYRTQRANIVRNALSVVDPFMDGQLITSRRTGKINITDRTLSVEPGIVFRFLADGFQRGRSKVTLQCFEFERWQIDPSSNSWSVRNGDELRRLAWACGPLNPEEVCTGQIVPGVWPPSAATPAIGESTRPVTNKPMAPARPPTLIVYGRRVQRPRHLPLSAAEVVIDPDDLDEDLSS